MESLNVQDLDIIYVALMEREMNLAQLIADCTKKGAPVRDNLTADHEQVKAVMAKLRGGSV